MATACQQRCCLADGKHFLGIDANSSNTTPALLGERPGHGDDGDGQQEERAPTARAHALQGEAITTDRTAASAAPTPTHDTAWQGRLFKAK